MIQIENREENKYFDDDSFDCEENEEDKMERAYFCHQIEDYKTSIQIYKEIINENENDEALLNLANLYYLGRGTRKNFRAGKKIIIFFLFAFNSKKKKKAKRYYKRSSKRGNTKAMLNLAFMYEKGIPKKKKKKKKLK